MKKILLILLVSLTFSTNVWFRTTDGGTTMCEIDGLDINGKRRSFSAELYDGKFVVLEEGRYSIRVIPQGYTLPVYSKVTRLINGKRVTVRPRVFTKVFSAKGSECFVGVKIPKGEVVMYTEDKERE